MNYGFTPSKLDGTENIIDNMKDYKSLDIPDSYSYEKFLSRAKDQGSNPTCVPYAISTIIEWKNNMNGIKNNDLSIDWLFSQRENKDIDGMSIKEALNILKNIGYVTTKDYKKTNNINGEKINFYGKLVSYIFMKKSLIANGPFIVALPVYNLDSVDFWNGSSFQGGHALVCIGYNNEGLILRNSWGCSWGNNGNTVLLYNDCDKIIEAWAII